MTSTPLRSSTGRQTSREARVEERRTQLAQSALATLGELGYAKTSLREIAQNSEFTHGVVHYYFADKVELISHCVRLYKTQCVNRFDEIVLSSRSAEELLEQFAAKLVETMTTEAPLHRLWYDLRTQSLFEASFRDDVLEIDRALQGMIWRVVDRYAEWVEARPLLEPEAAYALFDGLFEKALLGYLSGDAGAADRLAERVRWLLPQICPGVSSAA
jgi:TetR/AcrR family transcriptional regulator, transcriptional repressor of bet genes